MNFSLVVLLLRLFTIVTIICFCYGEKLKVTDEIYFDVSIGGVDSGRIVIGLFGEVTPKTVKNFKQIAIEGIDGKTYAGTEIHRVIQRFMIQGGDIENKNGKRSLSIYGKLFDDENFKINHSSPGFVSMANAGPNTNGCQFFITTVPTPWLDGRHVVFGKVVKGEDIVHRIEHVKTDAEDRPLMPVLIIKSGIVPTPKPFYVSDKINEITILDWIEAGWFPLSFSFAILGIFHYIIKRLDGFKVAID